MNLGAFRQFIEANRRLAGIARLRFAVFNRCPRLHGWWCRRISPFFHPEWRKAIVAAKPGSGTGEPLPWGEHVLFVSHFADNTGAPRLLLNIVKGFADAGFNPHVVILREGELRAEFARYGSVDLVLSEADLADVLARLEPHKINRAFLNTTVAGKYAGFLRHRGLAVITLVHELAGLVKTMGIENEARLLLEYSSRIVVPSTMVVDSWRELGLVFPPDRTEVMPQPDFTDNLTRPATPIELSAARHELRRRLGIPPDAKVVLGCGFLETRKSPETFFKVAKRLAATHQDAYFFWIGDRGAVDYVRSITELARQVDGHAAVLPYQDLAWLFKGADIFLLSAIEDPFPLVALMAAKCALPVVHCKTATGMRDLFAEIEGCCIPVHDETRFATAVERLLEDDGLRHQAGVACADAYDLKLPSFRDYVARLYGMAAGPRLPSVTCVIPNYNYARYLERRLQSVAEQTYRVDEAIILDDNSTDDSDAAIQALIPRYRSRFPGGIHYVRNRENCGVFRQWLRGAQMAHGDLVWIAEADDDASPRLVSRLVHAFRFDPTVKLAYAQSALMDTASSVYMAAYLAHTDSISPTRWRSHWIAPFAELLANGLAMRNLIPNVSGALMDRQALRQVGEQPLAYRTAGDWLVYVTVARQGSVAFWPESLNFFRRHAGSVIAANGQQVANEIYRMHQYLIDTFKLPVHVRQAMATEYLKVAAELHVVAKPLDIYTQERKDGNQ